MSEQRLIALLAVLAAGCPRGQSMPTVATRIIDGESRTAVVSPYVYEHFTRAELAAHMGDDALAVDEYRLARLGPADDVLIVARLAEALDRLGRRDDADGALAEGEQLDDESEALWLARARIAANRDRLAEAVDAAARAAELAPESDDPLLVLADLLRRTEATPRADAVLSRAGDSATALRVRVTSAIVRGDGPAAAEAIERLLRVAPARMDEIEAAARLALDDGRPALALHLLEHLPERRARTEKVRALLATGRRAEAAAWMRSEPPEAFGSPYEHAWLSLQAGEIDRAIETAEAAVVLGDLRAWIVIGSARLREGDAAGAADAFSRVPAGVRGAEDAREGLGEALSMGGLEALAREVVARLP